MKKLLYCIVSVILLFSCDDVKPEITHPESGTYILNNGNWGDNDSNIGIYNPEAKSYASLAFMAANGYGLGDLGQDMLAWGDEIYIAVNGSQVIFVTDRQLKVKDRIEVVHEGTRLSPRTLCGSGDKVYVTYYEGFVGEIDPGRHSCRLAAVGPNPDGLVVAGDYLYVAESGGMAYPEYNNTVSSVSLETFTLTNSFVVNANPVSLAADVSGKRLYVLSYGDYVTAASMLQVVDLSTGKVSDIGYKSVAAIASRDNDLYVLCSGYDEQWNPLPGVIYCHDMASDRPCGTFVKDSTILPAAYSISAPSDGYVYVGCSDYRNTGDMYVFTSDGILYDRFDTQGLNPVMVY